MPLELREIPAEGYEKLIEGRDPAIDFYAVVAVHDTNLGPGLGGLRRWLYASEQEAIDDARRLAMGMTYKSSLAGLDLGGGKMTVIGKPYVDDPLLLETAGEMVQLINDRAGRVIYNYSRGRGDKCSEFTSSV